jgi:hypothetical protein
MEALQYAVGFGVSIVAMLAASRTASRKHRSPAWAFFCFLFSPLLLVLMLLNDAGAPATDGTPLVEDSKTKACAACGGTVSIDAKACPHCGHPQQSASERDRVRPGALEYVGYVAVAGMLAFFAVALISAGNLDLLSGGPRCDSENSQESVK